MTTGAALPAPEDHQYGARLRKVVGAEEGILRWVPWERARYSALVVSAPASHCRSVRSKLPSARSITAEERAGRSGLMTLHLRGEDGRVGRSIEVLPVGHDGDAPVDWRCLHDRAGVPMQS